MAFLTMKKNLLTFALVGSCPSNSQQCHVPKCCQHCSTPILRRHYPQFGSGSDEASKREIAAFFAHIAHETGHLCYVEEIDKSNRYCDNRNKQHPCALGKSYYGRGPIQLTGNGNNGAAGKAIGFEGLKSPETVAKDPLISFKTALWFWMTNVHPVINQGFGATIQKINGPVECNGKQPAKVQARIGYYTDYCKKFGVAPGGNLSC